MEDKNKENQPTQANHASGQPTWHAGDADHVGVTGVKAVKQVRGLTGVQHHNLGGGVSAGAHPHPTGNLVLKNQLLFLLTFLLIIMDNTKSVNSLKPILVFCAC